MAYIFVILLFAYIIHSTSQTVIVKQIDLNVTEVSYENAIASFGPPITGTSEVMGFLVLVKPLTACSSLPPAPSINITSEEEHIKLEEVLTSSGMAFGLFPSLTSNLTFGTIAFIQRGNCSFVQKVLMAQIANYSAAIVFDDIPGNFIAPMGHNGSDGENITIPSVFVTYEDGLALSRFRCDVSDCKYIVMLTESQKISWMYIIVQTFIILFVVLAATLFGFLLKSCIDWRVAARNRPSRHHLDALRVIKFRKDVDPPGTCAICLEDFSNGDHLRVLTCGHTFHSRRCIDTWLLSNHLTCPICKRNVHIPGFPGCLGASDTEASVSTSATSSSSSTSAVQSTGDNIETTQPSTLGTVLTQVLPPPPGSTPLSRSVFSRSERDPLLHARNQTPYLSVNREGSLIAQTACGPDGVNRAFDGDGESIREGDITHMSSSQSQLLQEPHSSHEMV